MSDTLDRLIETAEAANSTAKVWAKAGIARLYCGQAYLNLGRMADDIDANGHTDVRDHRVGRPRARDLDPVIKAWEAEGFTIYR